MTDAARAQLNLTAVSARRHERRRWQNIRELSFEMNVNRFLSNATSRSPDNVRILAVRARNFRLSNFLSSIVKITLVTHIATWLDWGRLIDCKVWHARIEPASFCFQLQRFHFESPFFWTCRRFLIQIVFVFLFLLSCVGPALSRADRHQIQLRTRQQNKTSKFSFENNTFLIIYHCWKRRTRNFILGSILWFYFELCFMTLYVNSSLAQQLSNELSDERPSHITIIIFTVKTRDSWQKFLMQLGCKLVR